MEQITNVVKRNGSKVPFNGNRIENAIYRAFVEQGERNREQAANLAREVIEKLNMDFSSDHTPHIEEIQDIVEYILIKNGHAAIAKAYILYRNEKNQKRNNANRQDNRKSENVPWAKCWEKLDWAITNDLYDITRLNEKLASGKINEVINISEQAYSNDVAIAAEMILQKSSNLRMVIITGPSSSGKTTTTIKLEEILSKKGLRFVPLNVDNYFFDLALHPKDEFGDYDFETPQALDLELINQHLIKLTKGETVSIPYYDFKTGTRRLNASELKIKKNEILLLDSLHGLYPAMTEGVSNDKKFKLYLEPLMQMKGIDGRYIRWTDIRLMRRMLRDWAFRAYNPKQTLEHWHYVRSSELRNIIPFINTTDYIVSSAMPYELAIYKSKLINFFKEWVDLYRNDPLKEDAFTRSSRILELLQSVHAVEDDTIVPGNSVIREFIGDSTLKYH